MAIIGRIPHFQTYPIVGCFFSPYETRQHCHQAEVSPRHDVWKPSSKSSAGAAVLLLAGGWGHEFWASPVLRKLNEPCCSMLNLTGIYWRVPQTHVFWWCYLYFACFDMIISHLSISSNLIDLIELILSIVIDRI